MFALPPKGPPRPHELPSLPIDEIGPRPGWYAVSVNFLRGYPAGAWDGGDGMQFLSQPYYAYFLRFQPVAMAGYSIYIYHLSWEDANRVRSELGLPNLPPAVKNVPPST